MTPYPFLLTTDLHFTDHAHDAYRFEVFKWLEALRVKHKARTLLILGDLTDSKDNHPARLVNVIVNWLYVFAKDMQVIALRGNHDYLNKEDPFFEFLGCMPNVRFINEPTRMGDWVLIPHSREIPLPGLDLVSKDTRFCFMHQTVTGAIASNGQAMQGELRASLPHAKTCKYYSGDIHVPQVCGDVEYVGSPYPVHYGDSFNARVLAILDEGGRGKEYNWTGLRRFSETITSLKGLDALELREGDQIKLKLALTRAGMPEWQEIKRRVVKRCEDLKVQLTSIELLSPRVREQLVDREGGTSKHADATPLAVFERYCANRGVDGQTADVGEDLLKATQEQP